MNAITPIRIINNHKTLPVIMKKCDKYGRETYLVLNDLGKKVGSFKFWKDGFVSDLKVKRKYRNKWASANALLSIHEFIMKLAEKRNLDYITFKVKRNNKFNLEKLYKRMGGIVVEDDDKLFHFVDIIKTDKLEMQKKIEEIMTKLQATFI